MSGTIEKKPYGYNGYMDFSRLWDVLKRKGHNKQWLKNNGIHSNTIQKLTTIANNANFHIFQPILHCRASK